MGYWLQNWLRIGYKVDDYMWVTGCRIGWHIPLFMAAMVVLLVISVPYTGTLLFIQCFRRLSNHKLLSWIHKLKPFFDAYIGPYKDRHHYWTGMLLLVRAVLFLIFAANVTANPAVTYWLPS